ncbi:MAG: glutamine-hydrolyzing GMP synthase [Candidatus Bipolaricaulis sp.]|nr:glutamine-hydrolyzing GMP synthase [Candidatus Bipolaricaulis sp.]MDD5220578.1 glutamine-hydrolyzing GMP synthase [Candidatus Bipolaricaulis sp.]
MSVVILDFGSQYTRLIARRVREAHAYSVILSGTTSFERIREESPHAIILSGGPRSVFEAASPHPDPRIFNAGLPILGICYGMGLLVQHFGGTVLDLERRSFGADRLVRADGALFEGLRPELPVWMSHSTGVAALPPGWSSTAETPSNPYAAVASEDGRLVGVQFHPEVIHTPDGLAMLHNFLRASGEPFDWTPEQTLERALAKVHASVGTDRVLLGLSGGVDSSTLALLLARAGVDHLAVFVDHGMLRLREREKVEEALRPLGVRLETVDASERFLSALAGVVDPEEKRKIIGREFISVFRQEAARRGPFRFLAQGTLYPDVIESAGGEGAANIKSHHNVGGLPAELGFELLEPFRTLFKDEVRQLATLLGLPDAIRLRHPFPGPGLAVRILGDVTAERLDIVRRADAIFLETLEARGAYHDAWQALAVLTPIRSVGVAGDDRRYGHVVALRAVTSVDAMTADWARLPYDVLDEAARRITREIPQVGRVVYDITSKPPATIEWE